MNANTKLMSLAVLGLVAFSSITPSFANGFDNRHPRRGEVLNRAGNLNSRINANRGNLGGHFGQLKREDRSIVAQQRRDARMNGGYITRGQQAQLNREENHVSNQIRRDR